MSYEIQQWSIEQHRKTNHMYDKYLPYEFHLRMVHQVAMDYKYLLDNTKDYFTGELIQSPRELSLRQVCINATWGHDLIEDCRISYNDIFNNIGEAEANIIYAVTNEKGKTRKERANDKYYEGIRNTPGAVFVRLCDRIANVQYSKMTQSRMFEMYKKENPDFIRSLGWTPDHEYSAMFGYLIELFITDHVS